MGTLKDVANYAMTIWQNEDGGWSGHCLNLEIFIEATTIQGLMKEMAYEIGRHRRATKS